MRSRSRLLLGLASQATTSLTNFALVILVARTDSPGEVGAWTLAYAALTLSIALTRASIATPVILSGTGAREAMRVSGGFTCAFGVGLVTAMVIAVLAAIGVFPADVAIVFALSAPLVLSVDFLRYSWIANGAPSRALLLDVVWLIVQAVLTTVVLVRGVPSALTLTMAWGAGAGVAVAVGFLVTRGLRVSVSRATEFVRTHGWESRNLFGEAFANSAAYNLQPYVIAAVLGYPAAGALRVTQTLFAPLATLIAGLTPLILRELTTEVEAGRPTRRMRRRWTYSLLLLAVAYGIFLVLIPSSIGEAFLGDAWGLASVLLVPLAVHSALRPPQTLALLALRAKRRLSILRVASWWFLVPALVLPAGLGAMWGLAGVGWGVAIDAMVRTVTFSWIARREA